MNKFGLLCFLLTLCFSFRSASAHSTDEIAPAPTVTYTLAMPQPQNHYFEVTMQLTNHTPATNARKNGYVDVKMPVWTPGSYLVREYAKNVEGFEATTNGQTVRSEKMSKNRWRVYSSADVLTIHYRVYAYELTVRTSFLDDEHGYVTPAGMFMYTDALKNGPLRLQVQPAPGWKMVSTGLPPAAGATFTYDAPNFDILVDSPIEIGNQRQFTFTAAGVPHTVAMFGDVDYDEKKLIRDYQRVCEAATSVVGEQPCRDYTFIVHHLLRGGGGLEHLNSTTLEVGRSAYATEINNKRFLSLVAHEYFHLWNVKRIRPIALGPFDYDNENYTHMLWLSEGCTSFYGEYILRRAGVYTPDEYIRNVATSITDIENTPGVRVQSVAEASWDAWIKNYRPNENSDNSTISYYSKGMVLGSLLNLAILAGSNGERNLDDLMRLLWTEYYKKLNRGFTDEEFRRAAEQVAGRPLADFFDKYVNSTAPIDYNTYFEPVGLRLVNAAPKSPDGYLGATTTTNPTNGRQTVTFVRRGGAAELGDLNVGDEILAVDSVRVTDNINPITGRRVGDNVQLIVNRGGLLRRLTVILGESPLASYRLEPLSNVSDKQKALYNKWLFVK